MSKGNKISQKNLERKLDDLGDNIDEIDRAGLAKPKIVPIERIKKAEELLSSLDKNIEKLNPLWLRYLYFKSNYFLCIQQLAECHKEITENSKIFAKCEDKHDILILATEKYFEVTRSCFESENLDDQYFYPIITNYSNTLFRSGRMIESIDLINPHIFKFIHAHASFSRALMELSIKCPDRSVSKLILITSLGYYNDVINDEQFESLEKDQQGVFKESRDYILKTINTKYSDIEAFTPKSKKSNKYKRWCSDNKLTLSYCNILGFYAVDDDIILPNFGSFYDLEKSIGFYSRFNTLKQEYNSARYALFLSEDKLKGVHPSQKDVVIINPCDYPAVGFETETLKAAIRTSHSIFDKVAMMCWDLFEIEDIKARSVSIKNWVSDKKDAAKSHFYPIFWFREGLKQNSGELLHEIDMLRNYMEHRFLRVLTSYDAPWRKEIEDPDKLEYKISIRELRMLAKEAVRSSRNLIFYLHMSMHGAFNKIMQKHDGPWIPLFLDVYEDEWKN